MLLLCNFSASKHEIQDIFDTLSTLMYLGTPLKEIKLIFLLLSSADTSFLVIFRHFFPFFDVLEVFLVLIIGYNS